MNLLAPKARNKLSSPNCFSEWERSSVPPRRNNYQDLREVWSFPVSVSQITVKGIACLSIQFRRSLSAPSSPQYRRPVKWPGILHHGHCGMVQNYQRCSETVLLSKGTEFCAFVRSFYMGSSYLRIVPFSQLFVQGVKASRFE